jgi:hypothetical protein
MQKPVARPYRSKVPFAEIPSPNFWVKKHVRKTTAAAALELTKAGIKTNTLDSKTSLGSDSKSINSNVLRRLIALDADLGTRGYSRYTSY